MNSFFYFLIILNLFILYFFKNFSILIALYDKPDGVRKIHKKKVPCIGGFIFFINLAAIVLFLNFFNTESSNFFFSKKQFNIFFFFSLSFFIIGYLDDRFNLNPNIKLILFSILLYLFLFFFPDWIIKSLNFSFHTKSININEISYFFTIFAILLFINSFNMFDGINLQSVSYSIFILIIFYTKSNFNLFYFFLLFPLLIFFYLNYKNRCFFGDNGTLLLSFVFSVLFIDFHNNKKLIFADEIFLIMLIPGLDMFRLFITRIIKGHNPFQPDRNHVHHLLVKKFGNKLSLIILSSLIFIPNIINQFYNLTIFLIIALIFSYFYLIKILSK
jgi:UDP-GlcNAc:undecaprenyl-phosphate GlcNAc-1-phosphate transferase